MKRFRNVSAIVTLLAGFITAVVMIINRYSLVSFLWILIGVMVCFYAVSRKKRGLRPKKKRPRKAKMMNLTL